MSRVPKLLQLAGVVGALLMAEARLLAQPSVMWTASEATRVMSGPADSYYPVLKLPRGTQLEVYQRLDSGWLAVRPPEGSYSLVSATAIESVDYRTARIKREGAASRIGSALVDDTSAVHVRLQLGELVEVLDPTADPATHLVRIAPPAGEFRWVRAEDVSERPVAASVPATESSVALSAATEMSPRATTSPPAEMQPVTEARPIGSVSGASPNNQPNGEWRERTGEPAAETPENAAGSIEIVRFDASNAAVAPTTPSDMAANVQPPADAGQSTLKTTNQGADAVPVQAPPAEGATLSSPAGGSFAAQLDMLEIQLSRRIVGPANLWVFDDLQAEAARLAGQANQPEQMAHLRELSSRMARFAEIASRHRAAAASQLAGPATPNPTGLAVAPASPADAATAQGYDAVGILRPVVSRRAGAPPYALVDDKGEVITFVTPGPSVNLQAYLGQRVAVNGTRAYLPTYRRRNIQTARVQPLPETRTR